MLFSFDKVYGAAVQYGLNLAASICIFIAGRWVARFSSHLVERSMSRAGLNKTLALFLKHLVFYGLITFSVIAALNKLGVETSSCIAVVGAASLAVGLAVQGTLSNFSAGVMIVLFSPFEVGDMIETGGTQGLVEEIQIFNTVIITEDKRKVIVPNSKITSDKITVFPKVV